MTFRRVAGKNEGIGELIDPPLTHGDTHFVWTNWVDNPCTVCGPGTSYNYITLQQAAAANMPCCRAISG